MTTLTESAQTTVASTRALASTWALSDTVNHFLVTIVNARCIAVTGLATVGLGGQTEVGTVIRQFFVAIKNAFSLKIAVVYSRARLIGFVEG